MNEEKVKNKIEERWGDDGYKGHGRIWSGLLLFIIGGLLFLKASNLILFPTWFFTWPVLLIAIGLFSGIRHSFRGPLWFILLVVGGLGLASRLNADFHLERFWLPIIFMIVGLMFILRPKRKRWHRWSQHHQCRSGRQHEQGNDMQHEQGNDTTTVYEKARLKEEMGSGDFLDVTSVFGGVKKNVLTKNFKGGDIVSFMGGSEIDLTQADFTGKIRIDATNIFGGTKLIVPPTWDVQNDITAIFGGVDDKRQIHGVTMDPTKVLILDGTCLFGGIEIRSY